MCDSSNHRWLELVILTSNDSLLKEGVSYFGTNFLSAFQLGIVHVFRRNLNCCLTLLLLWHHHFSLLLLCAFKTRLNELIFLFFLILAHNFLIAEQMLLILTQLQSQLSLFLFGACKLHPTMLCIVLNFGLSQFQFSIFHCGLCFLSIKANNFAVRHVRICGTQSIFAKIYQISQLI